MSLKPRAGLNPLLIEWGAPDQPRTRHCSYCRDPFPDSDDFAPLILWNSDGWCAEFCEHCQAAFLGIEIFRDPPDEAA